MTEDKETMTQRQFEHSGRGPQRGTEQRETWPTPWHSRLAQVGEATLDIAGLVSGMVIHLVRDRLGYAVISTYTDLVASKLLRHPLSAGDHG